MNKNQNVYVTKGEKEENYFRPTKNPEWVKIMVQSKPELVAVNGVLSERRRVAFPVIEKKIFDKYNLSEGSPLPGKIVYIKSNFPQYEGHEPQINPTTKEVIEDEMGNPIYQNAQYTTDLSEEDKFLTKEGVESSVEEEAETQSL